MLLKSFRHLYYLSLVICVAVQLCIVESFNVPRVSGWVSNASPRLQKFELTAYNAVQSSFPTETFKVNDFAKAIVKVAPISLCSSVIENCNPSYLFKFLAVQLALKAFLKQSQTNSIANNAKGVTCDKHKSISNFIADKLDALTKLLGLSYAVRVCTTSLSRLGIQSRPGLEQLTDKILLSLFAVNVVDQLNNKFLTSVVPSLADSRRRSYQLSRAMSMSLWAAEVVAIGSMVSNFLKVPLKTVLAAGGISGLVVGLSAKDIASNILGGLTLLVNEQFTPGDFVSFKTGGSELVGRVERIGWMQTRVRDKDTRTVYVPNAQFVGTTVSNLERISHRKFETVIQLRHEDASVVADVVAKMRERLRTVPKLDPSGMPFRVSFARVGPHSLDIEVLAYFATKSLDELGTLQQAANIEILSAVEQCGAKLALPTNVMHLTSRLTYSSSSGNYTQLPVAYSTI